MIYNFNLDYFLINSELPGLADTLNTKYYSGDPEFKFFSITLDIDSEERIGLYNAYKTNTIGYLEQQVKSASDGQFDTIRPYCINGVPQYTFIDSQDELSRTTQPLSPLYSPIIISRYRYDELVRQGKYNDAVMTIDVDCAYGEYHYNDAFNAYQLNPSEIGEYKAKIPLSTKAFNYPITKIIIDVKLPESYEVVKSVDINSSEYTVIDGNLYFYRSLEELVFTSEEEWDELSSFLFFWNLNLDYDVHVYFATIIPYSDENLLEDVPNIVLEDVPNIPGNIAYADPEEFYSYTINTQYDPFAPEIIDTDSGELARTALAQTASYAISDYFNQYYMGFTDGTNQATRDYTVLVTFWSTLISTLILLPLTAYTYSLKAGLSFSKSLFIQSIKIIPGVISEIYEELYVDPYIEAWINARFYEMGGDEETAQLLSMIATSLREAITGGVSAMINQHGASSGSSDPSVDVDVNMDAETYLTAKRQQALNGLTDIDSSKAWKELIGFDNLVGIATAIPGFFMGGAGLGIMSLGLDLSTDIIQSKLKNYYMRGVLTTQIAEIDRALEALKPRPDLNTEAINIAWLFAPEVKTIPSFYAPGALIAGDFDMDKDAIDDAKNIREEIKKIKSHATFAHNLEEEQWSKLKAIIPNIATFYSGRVSFVGGDIDKFQGFYNKKLFQLIDQYSYTELQIIDKQLEFLSGIEYNGEQIYLKSVGVYGTINPLVMDAIFTKIGNHKTLTSLEQQILDINPFIMGGPAPNLDTRSESTERLKELRMKGLEDVIIEQLQHYSKTGKRLFTRIQANVKAGWISTNLDHFKGDFITILTDSRYKLSGKGFFKFGDPSYAKTIYDLVFGKITKNYHEIRDKSIKRGLILLTTPTQWFEMVKNRKIIGTQPSKFDMKLQCMFDEDHIFSLQVRTILENIDLKFDTGCPECLIFSMKHIKEVENMRNIEAMSLEDPSQPLTKEEFEDILEKSEFYPGKYRSSYKSIQFMWRHPLKKDGTVCGHTFLKSFRAVLDTPLDHYCQKCNPRFIDEALTLEATEKALEKYLVGTVQGVRRIANIVPRGWLTQTIFDEDLLMRVNKYAIILQSTIDISCTIRIGGQDIHIAVEHQGAYHYDFQAYLRLNKGRDTNKGIYKGDQYYYKEWLAYLARDEAKKQLYEELNKFGYYLIQVPYTVKVEDRPAFIWNEFKYQYEKTNW